MRPSARAGAKTSSCAWSAAPCPLDHAVPIERRDAREDARPYEHLEVVHGAGQVEDPDLGVRQGGPEHPGYRRFVDHEPLSTRPTRPGPSDGLRPAGSASLRKKVPPGLATRK